MWRSEEEILDDLHSGQPERVASGIRDLKSRMEDVDEFELPPFGLEILKSFGQSVPEKTQLAFLEIVTHYSAFVPPLEAEQIRAATIKLVLQYAEYSVAYNAALELKVSDRPAEAVKAAMQEVVRQGLDSSQNLCGAKWFVSCLLDSKAEVRQATLQALTQWPDQAHYREVIDFILSQLTSEELELLGH